MYEYPGFIALDVILLLSAVTSFLTAIQLLIYKKRLRTRAARLLLYLSVMDTLGALLWFIGIKVLSCTIAALSVFVYQAANTWTCAIGYHLWSTSTMRSRIPEVVYHVICWGIPLVFLIGILASDNFYPFDLPMGCWLNYGIPSNVYSAVMAAFLLWNIVFLCLVAHRIRLHEILWGDLTKDSKEKQRRLFFIQVCFLVYTVGAILAAIPTTNYDFMYAGFCLYGLQGFLNSLATNEKKLQKFGRKLFNRISGKEGDIESKSREHSSSNLDIMTTSSSGKTSQS